MVSLRGERAPAQEWRADRLRVPVERWLDLLRAEYLADFVPSGGSMVKFVSGSADTLDRVVHRVSAAAVDARFLCTVVDPARLRADGKRPDVHHIDRFFFEATRDVDWKAWAQSQVRAYLARIGVHISQDRDSHDLDAIAAENGREAKDLLHQYQREFATPMIKDRTLALEFRRGLTALGHAQLVPEAMTPTTEDVLLGWFAGRTMPGASNALKRLQIYSRIDRSNARYILSSFCKWLPKCGYNGLAAVLDFRPYEQKQRAVKQRRDNAWETMDAAVKRGATQEEIGLIMADAKAEPPVAYSQAAYLQMLQLLRRFIDEIDYIEHFALIVLTSPSFYDSASERNYNDYDALQTRIGLEVHDVELADPAASLVHLEAA